MGNSNSIMTMFFLDMFYAPGVMFQCFFYFFCLTKFCSEEDIEKNLSFGTFNGRGDEAVGIGNPLYSAVTLQARYTP